MNFAPFTPYEEPPPVVAKPVRPAAPAGSIEGLVAALGPTAKKLRSDYLMTSVFYYIPETNTVMEIETVQKVMRKATSDVDAHIRELNGLPRGR
jgi:hypothetical protein